MGRNNIFAFLIILLVGVLAWAIKKYISPSSWDQFLLILTIIPAIVGVLSQVKDLVQLLTPEHQKISLTPSDEKPTFLAPLVSEYFIRVPKDFSVGFEWQKEDKDEKLVYACLPNISKGFINETSKIWLAVFLLIMGPVLSIFTKYQIVGLSVVVFSCILFTQIIASLFRTRNMHIYAVSNKRLFVYKKLADGIYDPVEQVLFNSVLSVGVETTQLGRSFDIGDVIVRSFDGKLVFRSVEKYSALVYIISRVWSTVKKEAFEQEKEKFKSELRQKLKIAKKEEGK